MLYLPKSVFPASSDPKSQTQMWIPLAWTDADRAVRGNHNYLVIGRLNPGATVQQAQAEMNTISARLEQAYPADDKGWGAKVVPLREELVGEVRPALMVLLGAVGFVLLIACANVANLVLVKTLARQKEIAIRTALGASAARVIRQILSETVMLGIAGGSAGIVPRPLWCATDRLLFGAKFPRAAAIGVDTPGARLYSCGFRAYRHDCGPYPGVPGQPEKHQRFAEAGDRPYRRRLGRQPHPQRSGDFRGGIVAGIAHRLRPDAASLASLHRVDPGMDTHNVLTTPISLPPTKYATAVQQVAFFDALLQRVRALPGIISAGGIDTLPISGDGSTQPIAAEGQPTLPMSEQPEVAVRGVDPGFFETMKVLCCEVARLLIPTLRIARRWL